MGSSRRHQKQQHRTKTTARHRGGKILNVNGDQLPFSGKYNIVCEGQLVFFADDAAPWYELMLDTFSLRPTAPTSRSKRLMLGIYSTNFRDYEIEHFKGIVKLGNYHHEATFDVNLLTYFGGYVPDTVAKDISELMGILGHFIASNEEVLRVFSDSDLSPLLFRKDSGTGKKRIVLDEVNSQGLYNRFNFFYALNPLLNVLCGCFFESINFAQLSAKVTDPKMQKILKTTFVAIYLMRVFGAKEYNDVSTYSEVVLRVRNLVEAKALVAQLLSKTNETVRTKMQNVFDSVFYFSRYAGADGLKFAEYANQVSLARLQPTTNDEALPTNKSVDDIHRGQHFAKMFNFVNQDNTRVPSPPEYSTINVNDPAHQTDRQQLLQFQNIVQQHNAALVSNYNLAGILANTLFDEAGKIVALAEGFAKLKKLEQDDTTVYTYPQQENQPARTITMSQLKTDYGVDYFTFITLFYIWRRLGKQINVEKRESPIFPVAKMLMLQYLHYGLEPVTGNLSLRNVAVAGEAKKYDYHIETNYICTLSQKRGEHKFMACHERGLYELCKLLCANFDLRVFDARLFTGRVHPLVIDFFAGNDTVFTGRPLTFDFAANSKNDRALLTQWVEEVVYRIVLNPLSFNERFPGNMYNMVTRRYNTHIEELLGVPFALISHSTRNPSLSFQYPEEGKLDVVLGRNAAQYNFTFGAGHTGLNVVKQWQGTGLCLMVNNYNVKQFKQYFLDAVVPNVAEDVADDVTVDDAAFVEFQESVSNAITARVTNMDHAFADLDDPDQEFNISFEEMDNWNVSNVTSMNYTFANCKTFNIDLSYWDTGNLVSAKHMFDGCEEFNEPLELNMPLLQYCEAMFKNCKSFNQPVSTLGMANVTDWSEMFSGCEAFNQPLASWNVANATSMKQMFQNCSSFNQPLNSWDVSNVTDMSLMFQNCVSFNQPLNDWPITGKVYLYHMFEGCTAFNQNLSSWRIYDNLNTETQTMRNPQEWLFGNNGALPSELQATVAVWKNARPAFPPSTSSRMRQLVDGNKDDGEYGEIQEWDGGKNTRKRRPNRGKSRRSTRRRHYRK